MFEVSQCALSKFVPCNVRKNGQSCFQYRLYFSFIFLGNFTLYSSVTASVLRTSVCFFLMLLSLGAAKSPAEESSSGNRRITSLGLLKDRGQVAGV